MNSYPEIICEVVDIHIFILKGSFGKAYNAYNEVRLYKNFGDYQNMYIPHDSQMNKTKTCSTACRYHCLPFYSYFHIACNLVGILGSQQSAELVNKHLLSLSFTSTWESSICVMEVESRALESRKMKELKKRAFQVLLS